MEVSESIFNNENGINESISSVSGLANGLLSLNFDSSFEIDDNREKEINKLKYEKQKISGKCLKLKEELKDVKSKYNVRNFNKREARKNEKIDNLIKKNLLERSVDSLQQEIKLSRKKVESHRKKAWYLKNKLELSLQGSSDSDIKKKPSVF